MKFGQRNGALSSKAISTIAMTGLIGIMSSSLLGCDTVALISFQDRSFSDVETAGVTPSAGSCVGSDGSAVMRFVLLADDGLAIRPGDVIEQEVVDLTTDDLEITTGAIFEYPDTLCVDNSSCAFEGDSFQCSTSDEGFDGALKRCHKDADLTIDGNLEFAADVEKNQLFGVIFENSGLLVGRLPLDLGNKYPDTDGDGFADGDDDVTLKPERASDRNGSRLSGLSAMAKAWDLVRIQANIDARRTLFGLWHFSGTSTAGVQSAIADATNNPEVLWAEQPSTVEAAIAKIPSPPDPKRGNVYQAITEVLDDGFGAAEYDNYEKTLVVFVDGHDDLRLPAFDSQRVIDAANEQNVRLFIVHLDSEMQLQDPTGADYLRDDFQYWQNQDAPCASDDACLNFEECRVPTGYSSSRGGAVDTGTTSTFCMPKRDDNGRLGPIDEYAQMACETDGGYLYVKYSRSSASGATTSSGIRRRMQWLPHTMDGLWKVETTLDVFENGQAAPGEPWAIQSTLKVNVSSTEKTYLFSQLGDPAAGTKLDDQDTRTVLFNK